MGIYVVKTGDTVDSIAASAGILTETLIYDNQIAYPYRLAVGQALFIGSRPSRQSQAGNPAQPVRRRLHISGYAYPFISGEVLGQILPNLTAIEVFSYGFTTEGELVFPQTEDGRVVEAALAAGVRPMLTITPLGEDGLFNSGLVSVLLQDLSLQRTLLWNLGTVMREKGYQGLSIDFEYVPGEDRDAFTAFVSLATQVMNLFGYPVTVALAPKYSGEQRGILYEGMDYRGLGEAANRAFLMTYEWGYTYGPPMAVAPINQVRRVVEYAVSQIPAEKISLGIPNYGYDWPLPYERGKTRAQTLGTLEAVQLAIDHGVEIQFDETAQSPFFRYWQYGIQHEVWFEDVRSLNAKFALIDEYGLSGLGYWQLMRYYRANWLLLREWFEKEEGTKEPSF